MKTLIFHGSLRTLCPENFEVDAATVAEAVSALQHHPAFKNNNGIRHTISIDGFTTKDALFDRTSVQEIHIRPAMIGSGRGFNQFVIGVTIIALAIIFPPAAGAAYSVMGVAIAQSTIVAIGVSVALGGVMQMLMPQPTITGQNDEKSRYLSGAKNTVAIGTRIPLVYGTRKVYGHYISFDIDAGDLNATPESWYAASFTDYSDATAAVAPPTIEYTPIVMSVPKTSPNIHIKLSSEGNYYVP